MSNEHEHPDSAPATKGDILQDAEDDNIPQTHPRSPSAGGAPDANTATSSGSQHATDSPPDIAVQRDGTAAIEPRAEEAAERGAPTIADAPGSDLFRQPAADVVLDEAVDLKDLISSDFKFDLDEDFEKFMEADHARQSAAFAEIVQRSVARTPFGGFLSPTPGKHLPFSVTLNGVEAAVLHQLVTAILPSKPTRQSVLRLLVTDTRLTVQSNEFITVLQHGIDLPGGTGIEPGASGVFDISAWDFDKAFRAAADDVLLSWEGGDALTFLAGPFEREIALRSEQQFKPFKQDVYSLVSKGEFSLRALRDALDYAWPLIEEFSKKAVEPAIIEVSDDGTFCAGAPKVMSVTRHAALSGCDFSLRGNQIKALDAALRVLQEPVQIFTDERHFIFWDGATAIGWDRSIRSLREARSQLEALALQPQILIPRKELAFSIAHVGNLSGSDSLQVQIKGAGKLDIQLTAESQTARRANRRVEGAAQYVVSIDRVKFPIWPLLSALRGSKSQNAAIRRAGRWLCVDDRDGAEQGSCCYIAGSLAGGEK